jgi:hypothetical protein
VSNPICVGSDVILRDESERCWSGVSWEICDESVSSCCVISNSVPISILEVKEVDTQLRSVCHLYLCLIEWEMKKRC